MKTNLKSARKSRGLTQGDIASSFNVSIQTVFKWEDGRAPVAKKHWAHLASVLCVTEEEIEEILMQTITEGSIERNDIRPILNAQRSKLYQSKLIWDALDQFYAHEAKTSQDPEKLLATQKLEYERAILERDKRIFELEKQLEALRREMATAFRVSISSESNEPKIKDEVK